LKFTHDIFRRFAAVRYLHILIYINTYYVYSYGRSNYVIYRIQ